MSAHTARRYACPVCRRSITPRAGITVVTPHRDGIGKPCPMAGEPLPAGLYDDEAGAA